MSKACIILRAILFLILCAVMSAVISLCLFRGNMMTLPVSFIVVFFVLAIGSAFKRSGQDSLAEEQEENRNEKIRARRASLHLVK